MINKTKPFSIRLTEAERADLKRRADGQALGEFMRALLFGDKPRKSSDKKVRRPKSPSIDQTTAARALALLGKAEFARNLSALANAARNGVLHVTPETEAAILQACRDIAQMRSILMAALGVRER